MIVIVEPEYALSWWCKEILAGITSDANRKKQSVNCFDSVNDIPVKVACEPCFLIGSSVQWIVKTGIECQRKNLHPILLSNQSSNPFFGYFSCVYCDVRSMIQGIVEYAKGLGKKKFALFGINTKSLNDMERVDGFMSCTTYANGNVLPNNHIYNNDISLRDCFETFFPNIENYDVVLCANDFAAISLIRKLQEHKYDLNRLKIISTGGTSLSHWYRPKFDSVLFRYFEFGRAGFQIASIMKKESDFFAITVKIKWDLNTIAYSNLRMGDLHNWDSFDEETETQAFYKDEEVKEMIQVERVLSTCDKTDFRILLGLFKGETMEKLGERCFISQTALKYRIRRLKTDSETDSRKNLTNLLRGYISAEVLENQFGVSNEQT